jgi:transposase
VELDRPKRAARRHGAKSDPLDAIRAAREALGRDRLAQPRAAGPRAALQVRLTARRSAVQAGTDAQRQLHALVVAAPDALRGRLRGLTTRKLVTACGRLRLRAEWATETIATAASLRALARRIQLLDAEIAEHTGAITTLVRTWRPDLLNRCRVGPIVAATVLVPGPILAAAAPTPPSPCWAGPPRSPPPPARRSGFGATAQATDSSTRPCTSSS